MKIYTVLSDPREEPNNILITTDNEHTALNIATAYLQRHNCGEDNYWNDDLAMVQDLTDKVSWTDRREAILHHCNNQWLDSPTFIEHELNKSY